MKVRLLISAIVFAGCGTFPWTSQLPQTDVQVVSSGPWLVETGNWYTRVAQLTYDSANGDFIYFPNSQSDPPNNENPFGMGGLQVGRGFVAGGPSPTPVTPGTTLVWGDGRLHWDPQTSRWYYTGFADNLQIGLAVSQTSDPRGGWWIGTISNPAHGPYDFMRSTFTDNYIVAHSLGTNSPVLIVPKAQAVQGNFGGVIERFLNLPGDATPVLGASGTGGEVRFVSIRPGGGWVTYRHVVETNVTTVVNTPLGETFGFVSAQSPSGQFSPGNFLQQAWKDGNLTWVTGAIACGSHPCVYVAALTDTDNAAPALFLKANNAAGTVFPSVTTDLKGRAWLTAMETSATRFPSHVLALAQKDFDLSNGDQTSTVLSFLSVAQAIDAVGVDHYKQFYTETGYGEGTGPTVTGDGRGPDYLHATRDPVGSVFLGGQWSCNNSWCLHTLVIRNGLIP
jgi:hypothetical protein